MLYMRFSVIIAVASASILCLANVIPVPSTKQDVLGNWVGMTPDALHFYRMTLTTNGGNIGYCLIDSKTEVYLIEEWKLADKSRINIDAASLSANRYQIAVTGIARAARMEVTVRSVSGGWQHRIVFLRENKIEDQFKALEDSMANKLERH